LSPGLSDTLIETDITPETAVGDPNAPEPAAEWNTPPTCTAQTQEQ